MSFCVLGGVSIGRKNSANRPSMLSGFPRGGSVASSRPVPLAEKPSQSLGDLQHQRLANRTSSRVLKPTDQSARQKCLFGEKRFQIAQKLINIHRMSLLFILYISRRINRSTKQHSEEGQILLKGILKVDRFINHQVDPTSWMPGLSLPACSFVRQLSRSHCRSRHRPALMAGKYLNLPVVYARKSKPVTMPNQVYITVAPSHTKGHNTELIVSPNTLREGEDPH